MVSFCKKTFRYKMIYSYRTIFENIKIGASEKPRMIGNETSYDNLKTKTFLSIRAALEVK